MASYIQQVQVNIKRIIENIIKAEKANVRFGLVHYRDHTDEYVTKTHQFTDNMDQIKAMVDQMHAMGGGDGPEAVAPAFFELTKLEWRKVSTKIAIFIADAPPHGIEPNDDSYPEGDPSGHDPLAVAQQLVSKEVIIYSVGCEPGINSFVNARSFMKAISDLTGGKYLSLAQTDILSDIIIYGAREELNLEKYASQVEQEVKLVQQTTPSLAGAALYTAAATNLQAKGVYTPQMQVDSVVDESVFRNASAYKSAPSLAAANKAIGLTAAKNSSPSSYPVPFPSLSYSAGISTFGAPSPSLSAVPSPSPYPAAPSPSSYSAAPSLSPYPPQAQVQSVQYNVSPISVEQVQRLYERKNKD